MASYASLSRRRFLASASATALAATWAARSTAPAFAQAPEAAALPRADAFILGKDKRLIVHSIKTGEVETPLELLRQQPITPKELLFVRNNQILPDTLTIAPAEIKGWQFELTGLLNQQLTITAEDLAALPQTSAEVVIQCSGNGRARYAETVKASGAQWSQGAVGNVIFSGVRLADVLNHFELKPLPAARYIAAEGKDRAPKSGGADFEHSLPLAAALERSILATSMNNEPLPKVHGGPLRLVTPGFYGTMFVKWLSRLRFEVEESNNHHHVDRYRTPLTPLKPGDEFTSTLENSEPNWNMRIKSTIFSPLINQELSVGKNEVSGVAWNDGTAKITAVEISINGGQTWQAATLKPASGPYAWHHWRLDLDLPAGSHTILSRAVDALGRSQPLDGSIAWNPAGYTWSGCDAVSVTVKG